MEEQREWLQQLANWVKPHRPSREGEQRGPGISLGTGAPPETPAQGDVGESFSMGHD